MAQATSVERLFEGELTRAIIGAFHEVYNTLGYGHAESTYMNALEYELVARHIRTAREVSTRVFYKGMRVAYHRIDMLVDDKVIVEAKASEHLPPYAQRQLRNYLSRDQNRARVASSFRAAAEAVQAVLPKGVNRAVTNTSSKIGTTKEPK